MAESFVERELKFEADLDSDLPDVSALLPVGGRLSTRTERLRSDYYDTPERSLLAAEMTLRHRTGTTDVGWHLKVPDPPFRQEIRVDSTSEEPPGELAEVLVGVLAGEPLALVVTLTTRRSVTELLDGAGNVLAEIDDDEVRAVVPGDESRTASWREIEVELAKDSPDERLLERVEAHLTKAGLKRSAWPSKLGRALVATGLRSVDEPGAEDAAAVIADYLRAQHRVMLAGDVALRRGDDSVIHKTRVATRRFRSTLRTFGRLLDESRAATLDDELRWAAGLMGEVRDRQVLADRLSAMVSELDKTLVLGPVPARIRTELSQERAEHWRRLREGMTTDRYVRLLADARSCADDPPWTPPAHEPAATLAGLAKKTGKKVSRRLARAVESGDVHELHQARKAAKRARYAAEATESVLGAAKAAKRAARYENLQDILGEHQDALVSSELLLRLGATAGTTPDENSFAFGILYEREQERARDARQRAADWAADHT